MNSVLGILNLYNSPELGPLSERRAPATVSFLGRYALMDFALSNFTNSNINSFSILVKNNFRSVNKHVNSLKAWVNNTKIGTQNILITEKGIKDSKYNTDLNNIKENEWILNEAKYDYAVIVPGHILTQIDFHEVLDYHKANKADITVVYSKVKNANNHYLDMDIPVFRDDSGRVYGFRQNLGTNKVEDIALQTYIINIELLKKMMNARTKATSIIQTVNELIMKDKIVCYGYFYDGFLKVFDSFEHFVENEFALLAYEEATRLFDHGVVTYTITHNSFPAQYGPESDVANSYISNGSYILGEVKNSIISRHVRVEKGASVKNSIILTGTIIGENAIIENALIDKNVVVSANAKVKGHKTSLEYVRKGKIVK